MDAADLADMAHKALDIYDLEHLFRHALVRGHFPFERAVSADNFMGQEDLVNKLHARLWRHRDCLAAQM